MFIYSTSESRVNFTEIPASFYYTIVFVSGIPLKSDIFVSMSLVIYVGLRIGLMVVLCVISEQME